jgi:hypothetical protein
LPEHTIDSRLVAKRRQPSPILSAFKEYSILASLETDLRGLVYWWQRLQEIPHTLQDADRGLWHLAALANHADVLFTGGRGSDDIDGAVFRAFRDLGVPEVGEPLQKALDAPGGVTGKPLRKVIKRMRNSIAHRSYDFQHHGADFAFWGLGSNAESSQAFTDLIAATQAVLQLIGWHKQNLISKFVETGTFGELQEYIATSAVRAVRASRAAKKAGPGDAGVE